MILIIDNYDSFVYNIFHRIDPSIPVRVERNDQIDLAEISAMDPDGIIVSPGPNRPENAGVSVAVFQDFVYPTLGICLGHQALCQANGAAVVQPEDMVHGERSTVYHDAAGIFEGVPSPFQAGRYHSLGVRASDLPSDLREIAWSADSVVTMGVVHRQKPHVGLQVHPESLLTSHGRTIIRNFCEKYCGLTSSTSER